MFAHFILPKKVSGNRDGNNIVKSMSSGCDAKTANGEKCRKINTGDRPKDKLGYIKRIDGINPPAEEVNMMVSAE